MILFFIIAEDQFIAVKNLLDIGKGSEAVFNLSYVTTLTDGRISDCSVQDSEKKRIPSSALQYAGLLISQAP